MLPSTFKKSATYLPAESHAAIQAVADERGMTFSTVLRDIVRQWCLNGEKIADV